jgi:hypothetical protein
MIDMKLEYEQRGDQLYPRIAEPPQEERHIGRYGRAREKYLKDHRPGEYTLLIVKGKLDEHLADIEERAYDMQELIVKQMAKRHGVNRELKNTDPLSWVRQMNYIRCVAREMVMSDVVYPEEQSK